MTNNNGPNVLCNMQSILVCLKYIYLKKIYNYKAVIL